VLLRSGSLAPRRPLSRRTMEVSVESEDDWLLPQGVERSGRGLIVDAEFTLVSIAPGVAVLTKQASTSARLSNSGDGVVWVSCRCSKAGGCEPELRKGPDPSKGTLSCRSTNCEGACSIAGGQVPASSDFSAALVQVLRRYSARVGR
jgi:hypothetical protein